nr:zonular occludens toxin domain-containing protein [Vitreoscilla stercoraria]
MIIVDECHYVYPVRPSTKAVPDYISKLTELRHQGHTLIIMTQHPSNIDSYVRNLVSRHIHLARKQATTRLYEWNECVTSFSPMMLKEATSRLYKPPKKAFDYYKSSSVHVKHKRRVSPMVYVLFACIGMILLSAWHISNRIKETTQKPTVVDVAPQNKIEAQMNNDVLQPVPVGSGTSSATLSKSLTPQHFTPVLPEMPESKPIYDDVRKVQSFEYPVALIESNGVCKAYSDQGTLLDIPQAFCKKWLKEGRYNPYKSSSQSVNQSTIQQPTNKE